MQFLTETAMRAEEYIGTAKCGGVDWKRRILRLEDAKAGARDVPLSPRAIEILEALGPSEDPDEQIFGISYESLKAAWRRACAREGIEDLRIQDLRHTAATRMALKTGNDLHRAEAHRPQDAGHGAALRECEGRDVVALMHAPQPAAPAAATAPAAAATPAASAATMSEETLQAAMKMLQAAAAQMSAKPQQQHQVRLQLVTTAANDGEGGSRAA